VVEFKGVAFQPLILPSFLSPSLSLSLSPTSTLARLSAAQSPFAPQMGCSAAESRSLCLLRATSQQTRLPPHESLSKPTDQMLSRSLRQRARQNLLTSRTFVGLRKIMIVCIISADSIRFVQMSNIKLGCLRQKHQQTNRCASRLRSPPPPPPRPTVSPITNLSRPSSVSPDPS